MEFFLARAVIFVMFLGRTYGKPQKASFFPVGSPLPPNKNLPANKITGGGCLPATG